MVDFAVGLIGDIGLWGAGLLIAIEVIVVPIPSELVLLLTGFNVSEGTFSMAAAIAATTLASVAGALFLYSIAFAIGEDRVLELTRRIGKFVGLKEKDIHKTLLWFSRHGVPLVFFGRLVPIIRSLVSIPAGLTRMKLSLFVVFTALGSGIWNTIWISIGFVLGENWSDAEEFTHIIDLAAYIAIASLALFLVVRALLTTRNQRKSQ
jgi:membrane protein DedA with SNARE-associated domain